MASTINASTSPAAIIQSADGTADLNLQSNGSTVLALTSSGVNVTGTFNVNGAPISVAGGATTVSQGTSLTLTSASNRVQNVTMTATNLFITLPDATTLSAGGPTFIISNSGGTPFSIKLNGGLLITTLAAAQSVQIELVDNSTAAGKWLVSNKDIATITTTGHYATATIDSTNAAYPYATSDANGNSTASHFVDCLKLTSTTALLVWTRTGNKSVYGVVATNTSGVISYGSIVQIYDGSAGGTAAVASAAAMLLTGLTTGMVFISRSATAVAVPFSISGSTITVGTVSSNFGNKASYNNIVHSVAVLSSTVMMIVYNTTGTNILLATMTYNGASAPTLGTASTAIAVTGVASNNPYGALVTLTSTTVQLWYMTNGGVDFATRVVTSNGASAPTLGTAITATLNAGGPYGDLPWQPYAYSATETSLIFQADYSFPPTVASYTISGTTVTQTVAPVTMINVNLIGLPSRLEWIDSTTGLFFEALYYSQRLRYTPLSKLYKVTYTPSGGTLNYVPIGNTPDGTVYSYLAGMCLLSSTTGIVAGYNSLTGYISANVFTVL